MNNAALTTLRHGALSLMIDWNTGFVRRLCANGEQILQAVYCAVRGVDWGTYAATISEVNCTERWCSWMTQAQGAPFAWRTEVSLDEEGFRFTIDGMAQESFQTCRTGMCLLHPLSVCGLPVTVVHVDGSAEARSFPELVAPHQPFMEVAGFRYHTRRGHLVRIDLAGEVFETEDQRNWSDASFKTYCHRLGDGKPYMLKASQRVWQEIRVMVSGQARLPEEQKDCSVPFPEWGVSLDVADPEALHKLETLGVRRVYVDNGSAVPQCGGIGVDLRLTVEQIPQVSPVTPPTTDSVLWLVCDSWSPEVETALEVVRSGWEALGWQVGYGSSANFAELNRSRPPKDTFAWLASAASPQVHTFDAHSILENASALADIGRTMAQFGRRPCAGPITFESRFSGKDPRADGTLGAAYLLLALASVSRGSFQKVLMGRASQVLNEGSPVGSVMRELFRVRPHTVEQSAEGALVRLTFTGEVGELQYLVNPTPHAVGGVEPYTYRREVRQ